MSTISAALSIPRRACSRNVSSRANCKWSGNALYDSRIDRQLCRELGTRSIVAVPVFTAGTFRGVLQVLYPQPYAFGTRELSSLANTAEVIAAQIRASEEEPFPTRTAEGVRHGAQSQPYYTVLMIVAFLLFTLISARLEYFERFFQISHGGVLPIQGTEQAK